MTPPLSSPLAQLADVCRRHGGATRKLVLVPRQQAGHTLSTALAAAGPEHGWVNVVPMTPLGLAREVASSRLRREGWRTMGPGLQLFLVDALLRAAPEVARRIAGEQEVPPVGLASLLLETLGTLRQAGVRPDAYRKEVGAAAPLALLYERYVAALEAERLADDTVVFETARAVLETRPPGNDVLVIFDEVELHESAARFLTACAARAAVCYRIGERGPEPPPASAAARLDGDPAWELLPAPSPGPAGMHFVEAVGAAAEVDAVLHEILARGLAFDEVEIAYTANEPYLTLFCAAEERARLERGTVPGEAALLTLAAGVPAKLTRTGQAIRAFFGWIEGGYEGSALLRMLEGGLVRLDGDPRLDPGVPPARAATLLAAAGIGRGPGAATKALERLEGSGDAEDADRIAAAALRPVLHRLEALAPSEATTLSELTSRAFSFLRQFGPVAPPDAARASEEFTLDELAVHLLMRQLLRLGEQSRTVGGGIAGPTRRLARLLREQVDGYFVGASAPRPGCLHVVPLTGAGLSGRRHCFVVGLDEDTFSRAPSVDPVLPDEERLDLSRALGTRLPLGADGIRSGHFHLNRVLCRASGSAGLVASRLDLGADRELFPSAEFTRLRASRPPVRVGLVMPGACDGLALTDAAYWLAGRHRAGMRERLGELSGYAGARAGRTALAARRDAPHLTPYDGHLGDGTAGLDPLRHVVSPTRLERLASCPHQYFFRDVLGARVPPPPADEESWMSAQDQGSLLHAVFEAHVRSLPAGERVRPEHLDRLLALIDERLEEHAARAPALPLAERRVRRTLHAAARIFVRAEADYDGVPVWLELGFGEAPPELPIEDGGPLLLELPGGRSLRLRGWIDRVDRLPDGTLALWDYKTGSDRRFVRSSDVDLYQKGTILQWALYSYAVEQLFPGERVSRAGYFLTSSRGGGQRLFDDPGARRPEVMQHLAGLTEMAASGRLAPEPDDGRCNICDYAAVCGDPGQRKREMQLKAAEFKQPITSPSRWNYA